MVRLSYEGQAAEVSARGAIINAYSVDGRDIFFPRRKIGNSMRGGSHVCLPNFGPDEKTYQPQHGYGRTVQWDVVRANERMAELEYLQQGGHYNSLYSRIRYELDSSGLSMQLLLRNEGGEAMVVAPGFHPYFALPEGVDGVMVGDDIFDVGAVAGTDWTGVDSGAIVRLGDRRLLIESMNMSRWAIWTEDPVSYICIEPTVAGNAHVTDGSPGQGLEPGSEIEFSVRIEVQGF